MLYLTADKFPVFVPFGLIGFYRYFWYLIRLLAALVYRPIPPPLNPTYNAAEDVTIIVPTIDAGVEFKEAAYSWLQSHPARILIVTEHRMVEPLQALADEVDPTRIEVLSVPKANKRLQMVHGIKHATTDIIVFADDDAIWPPTMLPWILACFEDQAVGGVGTSQRVKPQGGKMTVWEILAAFRLSIRNFEIAASTHIDGGVPCLSGRTAAYRTVILKDPKFLHEFTHDYWLGKYLLNSGDDKFLTRWLVKQGWQTYIQVCPQVELLSTMKPDWRFLKQVLRWTRNTWRSDMRSIFLERRIWTSHPYVAYTMCDKFINPFTLLLGPCLVAYLCVKSQRGNTEGGYHLPIWRILVSYFVWVFATRTLKLLPHLWYRPQDIIYVPAYILFGYYFAIMKLYALCTLHETGWGTRQGVGEPQEATDAKEMDQQLQQLQTKPNQARKRGLNELHLPSDYAISSSASIRPMAAESVPVTVTDGPATPNTGRGGSNRSEQHHPMAEPGMMPRPVQSPSASPGKVSRMSGFFDAGHLRFLNGVKRRSKGGEGTFHELEEKGQGGTAREGMANGESPSRRNGVLLGDGLGLHGHSDYAQSGSTSSFPSFSPPLQSLSPPRPALTSGPALANAAEWREEPVEMSTHRSAPNSAKTQTSKRLLPAF